MTWPMHIRFWRAFLLVVLPLVFVVPGSGAEFGEVSEAAVERVLAEAGAAERRMEVREALRLYREADRMRPQDPFILQKIAQQLSDLVLFVETEVEKRQQAELALAYARRAVELAPDNPVNALSLAICYGKLGVYSDTRTRVEYSRRVMEWARRAVELDPAYDWAHHVLGRWHYEVAALGATKRFLVRWIYGGLPKASIEEAVRRLEMAASLAPERVPHHVELGLAYLAAGRTSEARASLERALALPSRELYDEPSKRRARSALAGLN